MPEVIPIDRATDLFAIFDLSVNVKSFPVLEETIYLPICSYLSFIICIVQNMIRNYVQFYCIKYKYWRIKINKYNEFESRFFGVHARLGNKDESLFVSLFIPLLLDAALKVIVE